MLVVDDEPLLGRSLRRMLQRHHECTVVMSAQEALEQIRSGAHFDVVLCDLMMPRMTGTDFYQALADVAPALQPRVVFMSGDLSAEGSAPFLLSHTNRRLAKPFTLDALLETLANFEPLPH